MSGNELEDRVHNFFAQENSLQGQHHSQAVEGHWPLRNSNFWGGSHRQDSSLNSSSFTYNSQNSGTDQGIGSFPNHVTYGLNLSQPNLRPDAAKCQSLNEPPNLNGFMYENQFIQPRQNETNFLAMDRNFTQHQFIPSKSLSVHELHQSGNGGPDHLTSAAVRPETPESPVNFNIFGRQQQRSHQPSSMQPCLQHQQSEIGNKQQQQTGISNSQHQQSGISNMQHQQSGISNMQHHQSGFSNMQHQLMIRKMQELQRQQQQLQHLDLRQHNSNNEVDPFAKPTCISQSSFVYGTPNSDTPQFPWAAEHGPNWMDRSSPTLQGSPSGHGFPTNLGQMQRLVDFMPQDQSLYGVPISTSKGLPVNEQSRMGTARSSTTQMPTSNNHLQGNELNLLSDQVGAQNEPTISRHKHQIDSTFGLASGINNGMRNSGGFQQVNSMSRSVLQQDFLGRQEVAVRPDTSHEKLSRQVALPQNEVTLDPAEEKILFGSDDNIWDAFGNSPNVSGEVGNAYNNGRLSNGLPSNQSGRWSALMQSAVAETSSSDIVPQDKTRGLFFHKNDDPSRGQPPSTHNGCSIKQTSFADENRGITSALNADSFPPANDIGTANAIGVRRFGENFHNEPSQTLQTKMSDGSVQSLEESGKRSNSGPLHHLVSERSQMRGDSLQYSLLAAASTKTNSPTWTTGQTGTGQSNGWNPQAAIQGDKVTNTYEAENSQNFLSSKATMMQGNMNRRSSLWDSNSVPSSEMKLGHANSIVGNHRENQGIFSLKDAAGAKSCNAQMRVETNSHVQNSYLINQWNNAHPPARSQDGGSLGRLLHQANDVNHALESTNSHDKYEVPINEMENCDGKENSSDSHQSNLSQHTSGGYKESGLSDATVSDSHSFPIGKQKLINQLSRKVPTPHKFHYHPMNLAENADAKPTNDLKQSTRTQPISQQNAHFGLSKMFGQIPMNSTVTEKGQSSDLHRDNSAKEPSCGNLSGHTPNVPLPFSRATDSDTHTLNNASLSSQNMLELLHKVDQSRNDGAMMQFRSSEYNSSSRQPEAEKSDGFGHLQHSNSSVSQGFGLQLGPPSQKLWVLDHSLSSQNDQGTFSSNTSAAARMGDKGQEMVPSRSVQSFHPAEKEQVDFGLGRSAATMGPGSEDSSFYKKPGRFISALHSGTPHSREIVRNQQIASVSGQLSMTQHIDSFNGNALHPAQRKSSETLLPDASSSFGQDNLAFQDDALEKLQTDSAPSSNQEKSSQKFTMRGAGISQQGNSAHYNIWTDVPQLQHNMVTHQVSSCNPESPLPNIVESSSVSLMRGCVNSVSVANGDERSGQPIASANTDTVTKMVKPFGKALSMKKPADDSSSSSVFKQKDIETFDRSLKPNITSHQNYISKIQMEVLKDGEIDSGHSASKRMRGPDNIEDVQQGALTAGQYKEHYTIVGASACSINGPETEDCKNLGFSRPPDILQREVSHKGNVASDDGLGLNKDVSQSLSCSDHMTSVRVDHPLVSLSPKMASSWFNQYGTFSNGQMLQIYDAQQVTPLKPGETPSAKASSDLDYVNPEVRGTAAPSDEMNNDHTSLLVVNGNFTSPRSPQQNITDPHQVVLRPNKRIKASPELHPWHKEISHDSQDPWSLSMAEADWNKAANRLKEKVEDDAELIEDWHLVLRSKRRLVLTTHLMQQLLPPAPADVICADAGCSYEILAYHISRRALGDACSMSCQSSNLDSPCDNTDRLPAQDGLPERSGCLRRAKATEGLMERAMKLEYDLPRLDKSAPILDLRVECQELEKFSIINRFAKFHGRGQSDNAGIASIAQRYVTALPMPKILPEGVQCLSL